jgi:transposase
LITWACIIRNRSRNGWQRIIKQIEVFYLPSYSPELNPDERLNGDLKQSIKTKVPCRTKDKLRKAATEHMAAIDRFSKTRKSPMPRDSILLPDH